MGLLRADLLRAATGDKPTEFYKQKGSKAYDNISMTTTPGARGSFNVAAAVDAAVGNWYADLTTSMNGIGYAVAAGGYGDVNMVYAYPLSVSRVAQYAQAGAVYADTLVHQIDVTGDLA